jgi:hypothetical protein
LASRSSLDSRVQEIQFREHLGRAMGPSFVLGPKPLRLDRGSILLIGAALGLLATTLRLVLSPHSLAFILAYGIATTLLAAGPVAFLVLRRSRRAVLTPFERGLVLEVQGHKQSFRFDDLRSLMLTERETPGGLLRRIALTGDAGRVRFEHFARHDAEDRLGAVLVHALSRLVEAAERKLQSGKTISGWDWVLGPDGLHAPADDPPIPLAEIGTVTVRQRKVGIWRPGERFPFFVVPDDTENAVLLVALLSRRLAER